MNELLNLNYIVGSKSQNAKYPHEKCIFAVKIQSNILVTSKCLDTWVELAKWLIIYWMPHFNWVYFEVVQAAPFLRTGWRRTVGRSDPHGQPWRPRGLRLPTELQGRHSHCRFAMIISESLFLDSIIIKRSFEVFQDLSLPVFNSWELLYHLS